MPTGGNRPIPRPATVHRRPYFCCQTSIPYRKLNDQSTCIPSMIISSATDFREAARRKLPPFLFHYLDGGAGAEQTLRSNVDDLQAVRLRQRVLRGSEQLELGVDWFGEQYALPVALAPIGLAAGEDDAGDPQGGALAFMGNRSMLKCFRPGGILAGP